jgi:hypothetical protein
VRGRRVRSAVRRELAIPLRTWGHEQAYVVGIGARPAELEDGTALVYHGAGYANGVMPLGDRAYFYDSVTPANRIASRHVTWTAGERPMPPSFRTPPS